MSNYAGHQHGHAGGQHDHPHHQQNQQGQRLDNRKTESTSNKGKCRMCRETDHHQKDCPLRCTLEGCDTWKYHRLMRDHLAKINNMKRNGGGQRSSKWKNGASINQAREDGLDSELTSQTTDSELNSNASV